ncbi:hypothetical protein [Streptomyces sp. AK010]|uniref:hypothetical protein n=1 Tax=Streptomyces sp. AK010 TaxID=2723074 RepID=UPI00185860B4|nr:hypothetical protein [Streptomyces sp. AK010]MBB6420562.1 hypothetical protein [Streptomyces sp. AK010]
MSWSSTEENREQQQTIEILACGAEGFGAAAVATFTAVHRGRSPEEPPYGTTRAMACFDRPFGLLTVHRDSGLVLVAGWVSDPPFARDGGGHVADVLVE